MSRSASFVIVLCMLFFASTAQADEPSRGTWRPQPTLAKTGAALLLTGYVPVVAVALPSTIGLVGRSLALLVTAGIPCWYPGVDPDPDASADERASSLRASTPDYLCRADHGSIQLLVPVAGPFLYVANRPRDTIVHPSGNDLPTASKVALYSSGSLQAAGAALLILSAVLGGHDRSEERPAEHASRVTLRPWFDSHGGGLSLQLGPSGG